MIISMLFFFFFKKESIILKDFGKRYQKIRSIKFLSTFNAHCKVCKIKTQKGVKVEAVDCSCSNEKLSYYERTFVLMCKDQQNASSLSVGVSLINLKGATNHKL